MLPFQATQAHQLATTVKDSVKVLQSTCSNIRAQLDTNSGLDLKHKIDALYNVSMQYSSPWSTTRPEPQFASPEVLQQVDIQAEADAAEASIAASIERLQQMQHTLGAGRAAARTWQHVLQVQSNRWRNDHGTPRPLLLCLPQEVLRTITHKAGKEARVVCTALRLAHGTPGSGLTLARSDGADIAELGVPLIDSRLSSWLQPGDVTQLQALSFLPPSTCAALASALSNLRAATILGGMHSYGWLPHVTSLLVASAPWVKAPLQGATLQQFAAVCSLTVTGCEEPLLANLWPVCALLHLTSLTLTRVKSRAWEAASPACILGRRRVAGALDNDCCRSSTERSMQRSGEDDLAKGVGSRRYASLRPVCNHGVWAVLAAVPKLACLHLDLCFNYHSDMAPQARPLAALTHLAVQTDPTMTMPDRLREVEVPFLEVLELLPALQSLHLLEGAGLTNLAASLRGRAVIAEALRSGGLRHLQLPESFVGGSPAVLAALLPPSLASLKSDMALPLVSETIDACFPAPAPLRSLDTLYSCHTIKAARAAVTLALPLLCERLPALTHLTLRPDSYSTNCISLRHTTVTVRPELSHALAALSNLQQLHIFGHLMLAGIAATLPLLPALTKLQLGDMLAPEQAAVLASMSRLRCLHLPWYKRYKGNGSDGDNGSDTNWAAATVAAMKEMRGLSELVLATPAGLAGWQRRSDFELLEPLPASLRRLVVTPEVGLEEATRAFGGAVDEICAVALGSDAAMA